MPNRSESDRSLKSSQTSARGESKTDNSAGVQSRGVSKHLWPVIFVLTMIFVIGALVFLWPILKMAGFGVAIFMVVAVLASSLTPLLLLRKILNRTSPAAGRKSQEEDQIL